MKKNYMNITVVIVILLLTLTSCKTPTAKKGVQSSCSQQGDVKTVKVTTNGCNVRSGCHSNAPVVKTHNTGQKLDVVSQVEDWYAVKMKDNNIGFVSKKQCQPVVSDDSKQNAPDTATPGTKPDENAAPNTSETAPNNDTSKDSTPKIPDTENSTSNALSDMEKQMVDLVNKARADNNVKPLQVYTELTKVARVKAKDMIDNNYFSHNSPTYGSPFDMMKNFNISYVKAGENIAGNSDVKKAHEALMNSPGHRKNILDPSFTHIGIGIQKGGPYGNMFSQMFVSRPQ